VKDEEVMRRLRAAMVDLRRILALTDYGQVTRSKLERALWEVESVSDRIMEGEA
jgi:hypothetical protein